MYFDKLVESRNQGYRTNFALADWEKTYGYQLSSSASSDNEGSESDSDNQKNGGGGDYMKYCGLSGNTHTYISCVWSDAPASF
ncbi:hypothetical protein KUTeg_022874 [Tegillarca granosa]|uniref:SCP domain-containing protein n=1 Tax=Tegillarca granosa TaxID=220873 RepID=A0ABQ9E3R8_TEGGR|nr:hypothetical protein KUTeg_022874 [Tegillarca granosa]